MVNVDVAAQTRNLQVCHREFWIPRLFVAVVLSLLRTDTKTSIRR